jgi:signal transduction histidine kinase
LLPADSPSGSLLGRVSAELGEALAEFRRVTESLRPPVLDQRGLGGALAELAGRLSTVALPVGLDLSGALPALAPAVELAAYRITAEAVTNAIRHARASRVLVTVSAPGEELILRVRDDGVGLRQGRVHGVGLTSMAQRAADLGGTCTLDGRPDGTTVTARLPVGAVDPAMIGL